MNPASDSNSKPNIVVILADDMGYGDIGTFGNQDVSTPNLDRLAADGMALTQHYSGSPVCAPARAALMTGRYPHRTGAIDTTEGRGLDRLALGEVTMADVLKQSGYATGLVGKWHLGAVDPRYHPNARGFDEFVGFRGGWHDYWTWTLDCNGSARKSDGRYLTDVFTEEAVGFIKRHRSEPFFLHVTYNSPHFPLQVPQEEIKPFRDMGKFNEGVSRIYAMNARMDRGIGLILEELDRHGLAENTIVLFASDNGPDFGGRGDMSCVRYNASFNGSKCLAYEGGIRVPAIIRWPAGIQAGAVSNALLHFTDWLPTISSAAGAPVPQHIRLDGENQLPYLVGTGPAEHTLRFWQWNRYTPVANCNAAARDGDWKLLRPVIREAFNLSPDDIALDRRLKYEPEDIAGICSGPEPPRSVPDPHPAMLFNLKDDPYEQHDLAQARPDIRDRLQSLLDDWFGEVEAERNSISA